MNQDEFIIPEDDNQPAPGEQQEQPGEVSGIMLDNDEQPEQPSPEATAEPGAPGEGEQTPEEPETPQPQPEEPERPEAPAPEPAPQLEDPGEFQPKDYSFDVTLADGTTLKVTKPEDVENLPDDATFAKPKDFLEFQTNYMKMVNGLEADKREWEEKSTKFTEAKEAADQLNQSVEVMVNEMAYLETKGKLPEVDPKYENADWTDPEVAQQPGVKERLELINYRAQENKERKKLDLSPMSMIEAYTQMQNEAFEKRQEDTKQKQVDQRKQKGAMVGGASAPTYDNMPDDMIVGSGGSIRDIGL